MSMSIKTQPLPAPVPKPLKIIGRRALISLQIMPFMHLLTPLTLALATLRNPPGMLYTIKIFTHLKKTLLQKTFKKNFLKNQQKMKFLIRGYDMLMQKRGTCGSQRENSGKLKFLEKFNLGQAREWFETVVKQEEQANGLSFLDSIPPILEKRRKLGMRSALKLRRVINQILDFQRKKDYKKCEQIFTKTFVKLSIPWTENVFTEVEEFSKNMWGRYIRNQLKDPRKKVSGEKGKTKGIKKQHGDSFHRKMREEIVGREL